MKVRKDQDGLCKHLANLSKENNTKKKKKKKERESQKPSLLPVLRIIS